MTACQLSDCIGTSVPWSGDQHPFHTITGMEASRVTTEQDLGPVVWARLPLKGSTQAGQSLPILALRHCLARCCLYCNSTALSLKCSMACFFSSALVWSSQADTGQGQHQLSHDAVAALSGVLHCNDSCVTAAASASKGTNSPIRSPTAAI